jgi:hypothetical protein
MKLPAHNTTKAATSVQNGKQQPPTLVHSLAQGRKNSTMPATASTIAMMAVIFFGAFNFMISSFLLKIINWGLLKYISPQS